MLLEQGITPLMAHPERNKAVMEQLARLEPLRRLGCKFQLTAGSLLGEFGSRAQTTAQGLLDAGWVDVVATDAHNRSSRRPRLSAARDWLSEHYGSELATRLTLTNPTAITGMTSFTVERGQDRLVFRDLPASQAPLVQDLQWSSDLFDRSESAGATAVPLTDENWSLLDFKIDAIHAELTQAVAQMDGWAQEDSSPAPEDWLLPSFFGAGAGAGASAPPTAPVAAASAPVPRLLPVIEAIIPTLTAAVVMDVTPQAPVQTVSPAPPIVVPVVTPVVAKSEPDSALQPPPLMPPTQAQSTLAEVMLDQPRGLRLRDMQPVPGTALPLSHPQAPRSTAVMPASSRTNQPQVLARQVSADVAVATNTARWTPPGRDCVLTTGTTRGFRLSELPPIPPSKRR
jgi:hypothetical protein